MSIVPTTAVHRVEVTRNFKERYREGRNMVSLIQQFGWVGLLQ